MRWATLGMAVLAVILLLLLATSWRTAPPQFIRNSDGVTVVPAREGGGLAHLVGAFVEGEPPELLPVNLKTWPFGHVTASWQALPAHEVEVHIHWRTDVGKGASNIWVGYSLDGGETFEEVGPFSESDDVRETTLKIRTYGKPLLVRWRGEDVDKMDAAFGWVGFELTYQKLL
jgi:hypothetical protein